MKTNMNDTRNSYYFLPVALAASLVLVYFIAKPFLGPLILASVFAFLFQPIYQSFLRDLKGSESVAAFLTTVVAIILVLIPTTILGTQIFKESSQLYQSLTSEGSTTFADSFDGIINRARDVFPIPESFELNVDQYAKQGLELLILNFGAVFSSLAKMVLNAFVFLTAFYFFLKDGHTLKDYFVALSPLPDRNDELLVSRLKLAVSASMKGSLAIGLIQGVLTGIGFAIFGVPNPALWGGVAAVASFLPGFGTALIIVPAIIYLFASGNTFGATGLLIWGTIAVGMVDNFLGPRLMGKGMQLHPLSVFISVLGGLSFFGPLGFLLGPLAMSVCMALIDIYFSLQPGANRAA